MRIIVDLGCFPTGRHYPGIAHLLRVAALGLAEGFAGDHVVANLPIVAIDTETTGRDPATDRVVEVACVRWERGEITLRKSWLVNPGRAIPQEAFDVHGISDEAVKDAPTFAAIVPELLEAMTGAPPLTETPDERRKISVFSVPMNRPDLQCLLTFAKLRAGGVRHVPAGAIIQFKKPSHASSNHAVGIPSSVSGRTPAPASIPMGGLPRVTNMSYRRRPL